MMGLAGLASVLLLPGDPAAVSSDALLARLRAGEGAATSEGLYASVQAMAQGRKQSPRLAKQIVDAWNAGRTPPLISTDNLQAVFDAKRDAVVRFDAEYQTVQTAKGATGDAHVWWTRWSQSPDQAERQTGASRAAMVDPSQDSTAMRWRRAEGRVWFARMGERLVPVGGASILGVEDSWLGAGACIGDRRRGCARAAEHDLGLMLDRLPFGAAIVESETADVDGVACVVLRIGWDWPCWIYLDPAKDFGPRRIDRVLDLAGRATLSRTNLEQFIRCGGVWLPSRITWRQYPLEGPNFGPGDEPGVEPEWALTSSATHLAVNGDTWSGDGQDRP